jgi:hypothetical protein
MASCGLSVLQLLEEKKLKKRLLDIIEKEREIIKEETGIQPSLEQKDVKTYLDSVPLEDSKQEGRRTIRSQKELQMDSKILTRNFLIYKVF